MGNSSIPDKQNFSLVINKITRKQFLENIDIISNQLSNELFLTIDDDYGIGSSNIIYMPQSEYDQLANYDPNQYYATYNDRTENIQSTLFGNSKLNDQKPNLNTELISKVILDKIYPVGSTYIGIDDIDPSEIFKFGNWQKKTSGQLIADNKENMSVVLWIRIS